MTDTQLRSTLRTLKPQFAGNDPAEVLLKYAKDKKLAPAVLERLGQVTNIELTLDEASRGEVGKRATETAILDVPELLRRYKDTTVTKEAASRPADYDMDSFTVGNHFRRQAAEPDDTVKAASGEPAPAEKTASQILSEIENKRVEVMALRHLRGQAFGTLYSTVGRMADKVASRHAAWMPDLVADVRLMSDHPVEVEAALRNHSVQTRGWHWDQDACEKAAATKSFTVDHRGISELIKQADHQVCEIRVIDEMIHEGEIAAKAAANANTWHSKGKNPFADYLAHGPEERVVRIEVDPSSGLTGDDLYGNGDMTLLNGNEESERDMPEETDEQRMNRMFNADEQKRQAAAEAEKARVKTLDEAVEKALGTLAVQEQLRNPQGTLMQSYVPDVPTAKVPNPEVAAALGLPGELARAGGTVMTGTRDIVNEMVNADPASHAKSVAETYQALHGAGTTERQERIRSVVSQLQQRTVLTRLLNSDEVLSKQDPAAVARAFETLRARAPGLAADINAARPILREALQYQGLPLSTFKTMQEIGRPVPAATK